MSYNHPVEIFIAGHMVVMGFSINNISDRSVFTRLVPPFLGLYGYHRGINYDNPISGNDKTGIAAMEFIFIIDVFCNLPHDTVLSSAQDNTESSPRIDFLSTGSFAMKVRANTITFI
jgi:hypothetical protein